jgi:SSS family solute:Na+ symporter
MPWFAVAATQALTALGGGHINGLSAQSWGTGMATIWYCIGHGIMFMIIMRFAGVWYRRVGAITLNEMFGKMFHPILVPILGAIGATNSWAFITIETQGMATVISGMTGLSNLQGAIIGAAIGILYVFLAGIKEIGYVNLINAMLMYLFGFIALIYVNFTTPAGWAGITATLNDQYYVLLNYLGNGEIIRTYVIGTMLVCAFGMNMSQGNIQSCAAVDSVKVLKKACVAAIPMNVLFGVIILSLGLASLALPDTAAMGNGAAGVVRLTLLYMPSWLQICIIGMFLAAMLSTFAMLSLAFATCMLNDILGQFPKFQNLTGKQQTFWVRFWLLVCAVTGTMGAVMIQAQVNFGITWCMAWLVPMFWVFVVGMQWKRSGRAAIITLIVCWILNMILTFTTLAAQFHLDGNNYSIFMSAASLILMLVLTPLDKNAKESYRKTYMRQRAAYDARRGGISTAQ